jgi:hypothetical protein
VPAALFAALALAASGPASACTARPGGVLPWGDEPELACFRSPDGHKIATVRAGIVRVAVAGRIWWIGRVDGGRLVWRPDSSGFALGDADGSGQTLTFSYVDLSSPRPRLVTALRAAAVARFRTTYDCAGRNWYANSWIDGWERTGRIRLVIQDGVHSEGCRVRGEMIGVIGDPATGRIDRVLTPAQVRREWCTPRQRRDLGWCYDEGTAERGKRR